MATCAWWEKKALFICPLANDVGRGGCVCVLAAATCLYMCPPPPGPVHPLLLDRLAFLLMQKPETSRSRHRSTILRREERADARTSRRTDRGS